MYTGPIIDCDVHHTWGSNDELLAYVEPTWRDYLLTSQTAARSDIISFHANGGFVKRLDSFGPNGEPPGSDYETLREQHLDRFNVTATLLTFDIGREHDHRNPFLAHAIARAMNDWSRERWLDRGDHRLYGAVATATHIPALAAEEVRRVGSDPRIVAVLLCANSLGVPFGHPIYDPILEAAVEMDLQLVIHAGTESARPSHVSAGGLPNTRVEFFTNLAQPLQHHLLSFVTYGTFEKYPSLKLVIVESGIAWLPWFLNGADKQYKALRTESPWVKRLPSEYMREHVSFTTQPLEASPRPAGLVSLLESVGGIEDMLLFATDYPHWDADDPTYAMRRLPGDWHARVFHDNAARIFRWARRGDEGALTSVAS